METDQDVTKTSPCSVCSREIEPAQAYKRIEVGGETFLLCCPMCEAALEAGEVQRKMMPRSFSDKRIEVLVEYLPAVQIGGDYAYVDWIAPDKLYLVVADVAGHGITSSLIMSRISTELHRKLSKNDNPMAVATDLNEWMRTRLGDVRHYATAFFALIDFKHGTLTYLNCGHVPQLHWSSQELTFRRLESQVIPLGLFSGTAFGAPEPRSVKLDPGDRLVLFTDGLTDASCRDGSEIGVEGVMRALLEPGEPPGMQAARRLVALVRQLGRESRPDDLLFVFAEIRRMEQPLNS